MDENKPVPKQEDEVKWYSYVALLFAIVFFSGILATSTSFFPRNAGAYTCAFFSSFIICSSSL